MYIDLAKLTWVTDDPMMLLYAEVFRQLGIKEPSPVFLANVAYHLYATFSIDPTLPVVLFPSHIAILRKLYLDLIQNQPLEPCPCVFIQTSQSKLCVFAGTYYEKTDEGWVQRKEWPVPKYAFVICTVSIDFLMGILWKQYVSLIGLSERENSDGWSS